ncbi:MAG: hypothetical protein WC393_04590 [Candidatus Nanoarchaeia archaeon]|jgi:hypothetical protein
MADDKDKKRVSMTQVIKDSLGSNGGISADRTKAIILLIGFLMILAFFVFPYIIGLGSAFFASSPDPLIQVIGIMLAILIIYIGGFR